MPNRGRPAGSSGPAPVLRSEEINRVLRLVKSRPRFSARAEVAFHLSFYLGLRAKEIASLRWSDVFDEGAKLREVLHLKAAYTKGSKKRDVFVSSAKLQKALAKFAQSYPDGRKPDAPLFRSQKGGHMNAASMARFLKQLYVEAGIPKASSHSGRRTFITNLAERGIDLKAISILAGHSNIRTTAMYVDNNPVRLARILKDVSW
ncbi:tyrosine-type recombinase/integrase [Aestuariivirga sp.]|uniref:tyrosine-type recombinase/integrase n=1 Tax=Aestuariivirga sp. TaxID=2650926 RepID=UPI0035B482CC